MKDKYLKTSLLVILLIFLPLNVLANERVTIRFTPEVEISAERMYLGQIARFEGTGARIEELKKIDLGPAPSPGGRFTLAPSIILSALSMYGYSGQNLNLIDLPAQGIIIRGAGQKVDHELVLLKVYDYLYGQLPFYPEDIRINLRSNIPDMWVPPGSYQIEIGPYRNTRLWGLVSLPFRIIYQGEEYRRGTVNLDIRIFQNVYVVVEPIERQRLVTANMVEERYMDVTSFLNNRLIQDLEEVVGKQTRRFLARETVLTYELVEDQKVINRNDLVTIEVYIGSVHVKASGKALEDGAIGQWIWVENVNSKTRVQALVVDFGVVQVIAN